MPVNYSPRTRAESPGVFETGTYVEEYPYIMPPQSQNEDMDHTDFTFDENEDEPDRDHQAEPAPPTNSWLDLQLRPSDRTRPVTGQPPVPGQRPAATRGHFRRATNMLPTIYMNTRATPTSPFPGSAASRGAHSRIGTANSIPLGFGHQGLPVQNHPPRWAQDDDERDGTSILRAINNRSSEDLVYQRLSMRALNQSSDYLPIDRDAIHPSNFFNHNDSHWTEKRSFIDSFHSQAVRFLSQRSTAGREYNAQRELKGKGTRKRTFREVIGEELSDPYQKFLFDEIRPSSSIFLRGGTTFESDKATVIILDSNVTKRYVKGFLQFADNSALKLWVKNHTTKSLYDLEEDEFSLEFTAEIVDFENTDLTFPAFTRHMTGSFDHLVDSVRYKETHNALQSCMIRRQLEKWAMVSPFKGLKNERMKSVLVCPECIAHLQESYIILKMKLQGSNIPDLLGSINRSTGVLELIHAYTDVEVRSGSPNTQLRVLQGFDRYMTEDLRSVVRPPAVFEAGVTRHWSPSVSIN